MIKTPFASVLTGSGSAFPERVLTNQGLVKQLAESGIETNEDWIFQRTGIRERRISNPKNPQETNSSLAALACTRALEMAGRSVSEMDFIIMATSTADQLLPTSACMVQAKLNAPQAWALDVSAACAGYAYALAMADGLIRSGMTQRGLVIGSDVLSSITNWKDRGSCILFGDGAGATVVEQTAFESKSRILSSRMWSDGTQTSMLEIKAGGSAEVWSPEAEAAGRTRMTMNGREVFKVAVKTMGDLAIETLNDNQLTPADLHWFIPHQANMRIIEALSTRMDFPLEKIIVNIDRFGNTSAATIPTAFDEALRAKKIKKGDLVLFDGFGAGFTAATNLLRV